MSFCFYPNHEYGCPNVMHCRIWAALRSALVWFFRPLRGENGPEQDARQAK